MSRFLIYNGYANSFLRLLNLTLKDIIEYHYMTFLYAMKVEDQPTREKSSQYFNIAGELISSITLLNALELLHTCKRNCNCSPYITAAKMFEDRAIFVDQNRRDYVKFCVQRRYPKVDITQDPIVEVDNISSWALSTLRVTEPYVNAFHGLNFDSLINAKFTAFMVHQWGVGPTQIIDGKPKSLRVFEVFSQIETNALLSIFIECINPIWYNPISTKEEIILAQWRLTSSIHELYELKNEYTRIFYR